MKVINQLKLIENIEQAANYDLVNGNVYGSSYIVKQNGKTLFQKHYGVTGENGIAVNDKTIFRLCSMTKPVTAFAILILVDRGMISLEDKVKKYIPKFKDERVKIIHILSHTSGIPNCDEHTFGSMSEKQKSSPLETVNYFANKDLLYEPFTMEAYNGVIAFDFLTVIIEKVTGEDFYSFLKREIFTPCGMDDTGFVPTSEQWSRFIQLNAKKDDKIVNVKMKENCVFEWWPCTHTLGGAGLFSTLDDYSAFAEMLLNHGVTKNGKRLLREQTAKLMYAPVIQIKDDYCSWGLGVRVVTDERYPFAPKGIYGWSGAYGSHFWVDPTNKITAVFMKNSKYDGGASNQSSRRFEGAVNLSFE